MLNSDEFCELARLSRGVVVMLAQICAAFAWRCCQVGADLRGFRMALCDWRSICAASAWCGAGAELVQDLHGSCVALL